MRHLNSTARRNWSYLLLADEVRRVSTSPQQDLRELYLRMAFNAAVSNLDDHPRNHAVLAREAGWRLIPVAHANRILDGDNSVRVWRQYRGLSVKDLAERAGISAAYLSQLEGGSRQGTLTTMKALAAALSLDLDDLT